MGSRKIELGLGVVVILGFLATAHGEVRYTITDLGDFAPSGINDYGQVAGVSGGQPSIWKSGVVTDLGKLGDWTHWVCQINDTGQVVGWMEPSTYPYSGLLYSALLYDDGQITELGTLGGNWSGAMDINDAGQIAGWAQTSAEEQHPFLWESGVMTDLGTLPGGQSASAYALNNLGQVVGVATTDTLVNQAFLWDNGVMVSLGTLSGTSSEALAINDFGEIVGNADTGTSVQEVISHGFLYRNGGMIDLGTLGGDRSRAKDINNSSQVVGSAWTVVNDSHAFLWDNGVMYDLNDLVDPNTNWILHDANRISDLGQIVGIADVLGEERGFLLTPIPEPSAMLMLLIGSYGIWSRRSCGR